MWNEGGGVANFAYGFQSSLGNVIYRSLNVNWYNWDKNRSGGFGDSGWMNNAYYNNNRNQYTGPGFVTGSMNGWVQLWWGGRCTLIPPSDSVTVSYF